MKTKKIILAGLSLLLTFQFAFAQFNEAHLNLATNAESVLAPKHNALDLTQVKDMVAGDNKDIKIAYESLSQAQRRVSLARAAYFPYGLGTVAQFYFLNVFSPLLLIELVTSIPSKIYAVSQNRYLKTAEYYSHKALRENIKKEVAVMYYDLLSGEAMLRLAALELTLMESLMAVTVEQVELGVAKESDLLNLRMRILNLRDQYLKFKGYFLEQKAAFNVMIGKTSVEAASLELQPVSDFLTSEELTMNTDSMIQTAVSKSYEITSANALVSAALKGKRSAQWSILSFSGIGFGYASRVKLEASKIEDARIRRQLVEETLVNNVYTFETQLRNNVAYFESEQMALEETKKFMNFYLEQYKSGDLTLDKLLEIQLVYLKDLREMVASHYKSFESLENLKRLVLGNIGNNTIKDEKLQKLLLK